jgi:hypothetical protein
MLGIVRQRHGNSGKADGQGDGHRPKLKPHDVISLGQQARNALR